MYHARREDQDEGRLGDGVRRTRRGLFIYLLKTYSPVNRTGSPQGFSLNQILQKLNTLQSMHILQT